MRISFNVASFLSKVYKKKTMEDSLRHAPRINWMLISQRQLSSVEERKSMKTTNVDESADEKRGRLEVISIAQRNAGIPCNSPSLCQQHVLQRRRPFLLCSSSLSTTPGKAFEVTARADTGRRPQPLPALSSQTNSQISSYISQMISFAYWSIMEIRCAD